jgi:MGT family glycosyltransferase
VYVTFDTVAAGVGLFPALHRRVLDGLAGLPVRVLVTTGRGVDLDLLSPLPPRVMATEFLPQDVVLAHASVMVTHGGFGTVLGGLRAGVPMVVTPMFADQADNAARLAAVGAGICVQPSEIPMQIDPALGDMVREAVLALLDDDSVGAAARRLQREMAGAGPCRRRGGRDGDRSIRSAQLPLTDASVSWRR